MAAILIVEADAELCANRRRFLLLDGDPGCLSHAPLPAHCRQRARTVI
ncbi:MAG: hypothetical protein IT494_08300 [Gammaproteobacteria bacterium]|nr:hypothetical protein [Gammaproteobacteria bacterium]